MGGGISAIVGGLALLGFLAFLAGVGLVVVAASQGRPTRSGIAVAATGLVVGVLLSVVSQGIIVVPPQEVAVVFQSLSGDLDEEPRGPGTHIIIPVLQEATTYTVAQQEYTMSSTSGEGAQSGRNDAINARTNDGQELRLDATVIFNVRATDADLIHRNWQDRYINQFVRPTVRSIVRTIVAEYDAESIYGERRDELEIQIEESVRESFENEGLNLSNFLIRELNFSEDFAQSIERKEIEAQELQRAQTEAERVEAQARGQANARIEEARGEAESVRIQAQAQADALALISSQLAANPLLIQYEYIQNLSDNVSLALVPSNSPFLFDFNSIENLPEGQSDFNAPQVPDVLEGSDDADSSTEDE